MTLFHINSYLLWNVMKCNCVQKLLVEITFCAWQSAISFLLGLSRAYIDITCSCIQ